MSQKKSVIFKHLLPVIKQYQPVGFTHEKIVALLRDEHDLDLVTTETFKLCYIIINENIKNVHFEKQI